jgi:hypothetical protein
MLLGLLDHTIVSGWEICFAALILFLFIYGTGKGSKFHLDILSIAGLTAMLLLIALYLNANLTLSEKTVTLPVISRGCRNCSKADPATHQPYVVVVYRNKKLELNSSREGLSEYADSCAIMATKGVLGLEFVRNWQLKE